MLYCVNMDGHLIHLKMFVDSGAEPISMRCPACRQQGTFAPLGGRFPWDIAVGGSSPAVHLGHRRCPNPACALHVFAVFNPRTAHTPAKIVVSYPAERIDFDSSGVPQTVLKALEEAITCHAAGCYIASAMLVRKTLEELCEVEGATGGNLKTRIAALGAKATIPERLFDGLDNLRLLGNDAAHVEAKDYDQIGKEEVEVSIAFTKEVIKAVYQYTSLVQRMEALKSKKNP